MVFGVCIHQSILPMKIVSICTINVVLGQLVIGSVLQEIDVEIGRIQRLWNIGFLMKL